MVSVLARESSDDLGERSVYHYIAVKCGKCGKSIALAEISGGVIPEIHPAVWENVTCPYPNCGHSFVALVDDLVLIHSRRRALPQKEAGRQ